MKTFSALLAICVGNSPVPGEFPAQRPVTRGFDAPSHSLWRHCNDGGFYCWIHFNCVKFQNTASINPNFLLIQNKRVFSYHTISAIVYVHYDDVIMGAMASQITSRLFTQPFIQAQIKENIKAPRHWPLWGNSLLTGEFPAQMASNAENVSIWWRHHVDLLKKMSVSTRKETAVLWYSGYIWPTSVTTCNHTQEYVWTTKLWHRDYGLTTYFKVALALHRHVINMQP